MGVLGRSSPEEEGDVDMAYGSTTAHSSGELLASKSWWELRGGSTKLEPVQQHKGLVSNSPITSACSSSPSFTIPRCKNRRMQQELGCLPNKSASCQASWMG